MNNSPSEAKEHSAEPRNWHYSEPWSTQWSPEGTDIISSEGKVAQTYQKYPKQMEDANARRIVACVNFCATVPQDEIAHGFLKAYKDVIQQQGRDIELLKAERNGWQQRAIAAENPPPKDFANPQFHFRGIHFLFVTEENHPWKNWLCYKHAEGQWVSLFKCESPQLRLLTDLQSQLADLKRENKRLIDEGKCPCALASKPCNEMCSCVHPASSVGCMCCSKYGSDEQRRAMANVIVEAVTTRLPMEQERDQLKAQNAELKARR